MKKLNKTVILILITLLALGYVGYDLLQKEKVKIQQQSAQIGFTQAVRQVYQVALRNGKVEITNNGEVMTLILDLDFEE